MRPEHLLKRLDAVLDEALVGLSRVRNSDGEFAPQSGEGPDANAMARTYGDPASRPQVNSLVRSSMVAGGLGGTTIAALLARKLRGRKR